MIRMWIVGIGFLVNFSPLPAQTLRVEISGIRSEAGEVRVSFFTHSAAFDQETPAFEKVVSKKGMREGQIVVTIEDLPPGSYGIAVLNDQNANGKMDYRWLKPAEGYGFSGLTTRKLRRPRFEEFRFNFGASDQTVKVNLIYW